jgi:DNA-binding NarL/FixJ family response regulator
VIGVLLVDDEPLVCAHLTTILSSAADISVLGSAHDGAEAVELAVRLRPDVVLLDLRMPGVDGLAAIPRLTALVAAPAVVALTTFDADDYVLRAMEAGASGFLLKSTSPGELVDLVRAAATGNSVMSPAAMQRLLRATQRHTDAQREERRRARALLERLTEREVEIVVCLGRGHSNAQIAADLDLAESTVKGYVSRVMAKLACDNRTQVGLVAYDAGLVDIRGARGS